VGVSREGSKGSRRRLSATWRPLAERVFAGTGLGSSGGKASKLKGGGVGLKSKKGSGPEAVGVKMNR